MNWKLNFKLLFGLLLGTFFTTPAWAQPSSFEEGPAFEGTITWQFNVRGLEAEAITSTNPISLMTMHIRQGDYIVHLYGRENTRDPLIQPFGTTQLYVNDSDWTYGVDAQNQRVFKGSSYQNPDSVPPVARFTGDSLKILNVWCYAFQVIKPNDRITYYISPKYRVNLGYFAGKKNATANFLTQGLYGCIPLMTIRENAQRKIEIKAVQLQPRLLDKANFQIPPGFTILNTYDYRRL